MTRDSGRRTESRLVSSGSIRHAYPDFMSLTNSVGGRCNGSLECALFLLLLAVST